MKSNYKRLGDYIRTVDERNYDLSITNLQGVSITKEFIPSIANIIGTDLSTYRIVRTGQFAYGPVTSRNGEKVSRALLKGEDCIISSSYVPFEVYKPEELLPEYLMLWFMRPEFDRYARFMSNGSAREVFDWESMCGVELPVPPIDEQRKIVHDYQVITDRIALLRRLNNCLEKVVQIYFDNLSKAASKRGTLQLEEIISFENGKSRPISNGKIPVYGGNGIMSYTDRSNAEKVVIIGRVGAYCGSVYFESNPCWVSDNAIIAKSAVSDDEYFDYCLLKRLNLYNHHIGSGQQLLTQGILYAITCPAFDSDEIVLFNHRFEAVFRSLERNNRESTRLETAANFVIDSIATQ